jgi:phosphohistidine phosphatase
MQMFFLMRHAQASWQAASDFERPLTAQGVESIEQLLAKHGAALTQVSKIVCSPYLRTRQTAQIVADYLAVETLLIEPNITPDNSVNEAVKALESHWCDNLLVITHQPLIGDLVCFLEYGDMGLSEPVDVGAIYSYQLAWPGFGCAQRKSLFVG